MSLERFSRTTCIAPGRLYRGSAHVNNVYFYVLVRTRVVAVPWDIFPVTAKHTNTHTGVDRNLRSVQRRRSRTKMLSSTTVKFAMCCYALTCYTYTKSSLSVKKNEYHGQKLSEKAYIELHLTLCLPFNIHIIVIRALQNRIHSR